jgi:hypothetical protein
LFEIYRRQAASVWLEASGTSMGPLITPGTWLLVEFGAAPARLGEIVLFAQGEALVSHRLVARRRRPDAAWLVVKGDAEPACDPLLHPDDVLGVVRALRSGAAGQAVDLGCGGWPARVAARLSYWSARGAALARRGAPFFPDPLRRLVLRAIPPLARVATHSWLTILRRVA